jgi:hypothetical protein
MFYGKITQKGFDAVEDSKRFMRKVDIAKFHRKKAFEVLLRDWNDLLVYIFGDVSPLPIDQMARLGFMFDDGHGNHFFTHQTFAEFFAAEFFVQEIFENENEDETMMGLLYYTIRSNEVVMRFIDDKSEDFKTGGKFQRSSSFPAVFRSFAMEIFVMRHFAEHRCLNLIKLLTVCLMKHRKKLLESWMHLNGGSILMRAALFQNIDFNEKLWKFAEETFTKDEVKQLLTCEEKFIGNILHSALRNQDSKVFDFFVEKSLLFLTDTELERLFTPEVPMWIVKHLKHCLSFYEENFEVEKMRELLLSTNFDGRTILYRLATDESDDDFQAIVESLHKLAQSEIKSLVLKRNLQNSTFLMHLGQKGSKARVAKAWEMIEESLNKQEQRELLMHEDMEKRNVLEFSALNCDREAFGHVVELYEKLFNAETVKEIFAKGFETPKNVLQFAVEEFDLSKSTFEALWSYLEELFGSQKLKELLAKRCKFVNFVVSIQVNRIKERLPTIEAFILRICSEDDSPATFYFWIFAAMYSSVKFMKKLVEKVEAKPELSREFFTKLIEFKILDGKSIIECSKLNDDKEMHEFVSSEFVRK